MLIRGFCRFWPFSNLLGKTLINRLWGIQIWKFGVRTFQDQKGGPFWSSKVRTPNFRVRTPEFPIGKVGFPSITYTPRLLKIPIGISEYGIFGVRTPNPGVRTFEDQKGPPFWFPQKFVLRKSRGASLLLRWRPARELYSPIEQGGSRGEYYIPPWSLRIPLEFSSKSDIHWY